MLYWPAKAPGDVQDFAFNFSGLLQEGEAIAAKAFAVAGVTKDSDTEADGIVTVWLSAGALGTPGIITCTVTTNSTPARKYSSTAILPIGEEPVSLDMARRQLKNEGTTADDDYVLELIQAAREYVEAYCGIRLTAAAVPMTFASFAALERLTQAPIGPLVDVRYLDGAGVEQVLDAATYEFINVDADVLRPRIRLAYNKAWPAIRVAEDAVRVNAVAGYTAVPRPIIRAMLLLISHWYDNRNPIAVDVRGVPTELAHAVEAQLANFRR